MLSWEAFKKSLSLEKVVSSSCREARADVWDQMEAGGSISLCSSNASKNKNLPNTCAYNGQVFVCFCISLGRMFMACLHAENVNDYWRISCWEPLPGTCGLI